MGAPLVLCCSVSEWPPFQRLRGPPGSAPSSITASRAAVGTEQEEGGVGDSSGRTPGGHQQRQDGWLTKKRKENKDTPHPSPTQKRERRQMRRIKKTLRGEEEEEEEDEGMRL